MIDAAGFCCYGVVDALGVCNGWDASGRIGLTVMAKRPGGASAAAIAGYLGIDTSRLHSVTSKSGCVYCSHAIHGSFPCCCVRRDEQLQQIYQKRALYCSAIHVQVL